MFGWKKENLEKVGREGLESNLEELLPVSQIMLAKFLIHKQSIFACRYTPNYSKIPKARTSQIASSLPPLKIARPRSNSIFILQHSTTREGIAYQLLIVVARCEMSIRASSFGIGIYLHLCSVLANNFLA